MISKPPSTGTPYQILEDGWMFGNNTNFVSSSTPDNNFLQNNLYAGRFRAFWTFRNVNIPQGATITSAKLRWRVYGPGSNTTGGVDGNWCMHDVDNSWAPTSASEFAGFAKTAWIYLTSVFNSYNWSIDKQEQTSYDFASRVQLIVDRAGWVSGNTMTVILWDYGSIHVGCNKASYSKENGDDSLVTELEVTYT